jgi:hypothetical protein
MFCDLVDSTGIAARLDAEEWRDLVGAYLGAASAAVAEMGGKVAKKLGDGLMALFGHPVAERAVRAALAIQRALAEMNRKNGAPARFSAYCGKWLSCSARGEMKSDKIQHLPRGINCIWRSYAALGKFSHAWRCVGEAMTAA